jgi:hypothetical protein
MTDLVTIERASELTGYGAAAIRTKIERGVWLKDRVWVRAPDGRILISIRGYEAWVAGQEYEPLAPAASGSASSGKGSGNVSAFGSRRRRPTSSTPNA